MSWPHKDDGTVDWETVFEDPEVGLATYVGRAHSPKALGQCAHVIVQSLFIREHDGDYRNAFNHMIDELIESSDVADDPPRAHDLVLKLVREFKANRIKHAERYIENGAAPRGEDEQCRRTEHDPTEALKALEGDDAGAGDEGTA